jgi:hypothetical protein
MSSVAATNVIVPGINDAVGSFTSSYYGESLSIDKTRAILLDESVYKILPDRRVHRSMSRAALLLSLVCLELQPSLKPFLDRSSFSIGIYCAIENGPIDLSSTVEMLHVPESEYAEQYRKTHNPKMFLMQLPNLAAAQLGIFLGIMGPVNVFNSSRYGSIHALEQAEKDLAEGYVEAALVCSAFSFENPLVLERIRRQDLMGRVLCEGAAAMLLTADGNVSEWSGKDVDSADSYFGISHQLVIQILNTAGGKQC